MAKYLDSAGVTKVWDKTKAKISEDIKTKVTDKLGKASGYASLGTDGKLPTTQLPAFKTINGTSVVGSGNIVLDLSLYKIVTTLPTTGMDKDKIYLVRNEQPDDIEGNAPKVNLYSEYIYDASMGVWELLGEYKTDIDLTPYVKFTDLATTSKAGAMSVTDKKKVNNIPTSVINPPVTLTRNSTGGTLTLHKVNLETGAGSEETVSIGAASTSQAGFMTSDMVTKLNSISDNANNYSLPLATSSVRGGIKIGYTQSGKNYPVVLSNEQAYVNVPWTDTTYSAATASANGLMTSAQFTKLSGVAVGATADSALTAAEVEALLV